MKQINLLESALEVRLFNRTPRGLTLTNAGKSYYQDAKYMIQYVRDAQVRARNAMQNNENKYGVQLEAWAPFGEGRKGTFDNPVIAEIAGKYHKTPRAQVMLRWHIQRGVVVIPKSTHFERMEQNFQAFDFNLSGEDMEAIAALDEAESSFFSH